MNNWESIIIQRTLVVPTRLLKLNQPNKESIKLACKLDNFLVKIGFKLTKDLIEYLSAESPARVRDLSNLIVGALRKTIGGNKKHNVYFKKFPNEIPDTMEFWFEQIIKLFFTGTCEYGSYQHTYNEMLQFHDQYVPSMKDRITFVHKGETIEKECHNLYMSLARSTIPLNDYDRNLLKELASFCILMPQPESIPVRENKAIVNRIRIDNGYFIICDTITDVLRLACAMSDGDETLLTPTKFKSFSKKERRILISALNDVLNEKMYQLQEVKKYQERWKRLGERLHPFDFKNVNNAHELFNVVFNNKKCVSIYSKIETAFSNNDMRQLLSMLKNMPGYLFRNIDRIVTIIKPGEKKYLYSTLQEVIDKVSTKVILSCREHLINRSPVNNINNRIFINQKGTSWVREEHRKYLSQSIVKQILKIFDNEIKTRMSHLECAIINEDMINVSIPFSNKTSDSGFNVMPRGSITKLNFDVLRFFVYWKESTQRTDYDLGCLFLNDQLDMVDRVSWTNLRSGNMSHSGDITESRRGASEFINIPLNEINENYHYVIPAIHHFCGDTFKEVKECFFGYMGLDELSKGKPFEPAAVRIKSDIRGNGKVALPLVFIKGNDGWYVKWMNLYLTGLPYCNMIEKDQSVQTSMMRSIVEKEFLTMSYLYDMFNMKLYNEESYEDPITYIGIQKPENIHHPDSKVYTLNNLYEILV